MGGLVRGFDWWWKYFYDKFYILGPHVRGQITLPYGQQEVKIDVSPGRISQVYLHDFPSSEIPVCAGNINYFGCIQDKHDFTIYAQVNTNTTTVYWIVVLVDPPYYIPGQ